MYEHLKVGSQTTLIKIQKNNRSVLSSYGLVENFDYLVQESRFWTKSKQYVFNKTNSGTIPKRFVLGFVPKRYRNVVLTFLTLRDGPIFFQNSILMKDDCNQICMFSVVFCTSLVIL
jgi:hypothetical protein